MIFLIIRPYVRPTGRPPARFYHNLISFNCFCKNQVFPIVYCLMTRKTTGAYIDVFKYIEEHLIKLQPASFMADNECGMRCAIKEVWPNIIIKRCLFHFKRAVNSKCTSLGMSKFLREKRNGNARKLKRMLLNILLLPANKIQEGYSSAQLFAKQKNLSTRFAKLFSYYEMQWMKKVLSCSLRINKILESVFHHTFYLGQKRNFSCLFEYADNVISGINKFRYTSNISKASPCLPIYCQPGCMSQHVHLSCINSILILLRTSM